MTLPVLLPPLPPVLAPLPPLAPVPAAALAPAGPAKWRPGLPAPCPKPWAVTDWYPMRIPPDSERPGLYDVKFEKGAGVLQQVHIARHYWTGRQWPTLRGKLTAVAWRGVQTPSGEAAL